MLVTLTIGVRNRNIVSIVAILIQLGAAQESLGLPNEPSIRQDKAGQVPRWHRYSVPVPVYLLVSGFEFLNRTGEEESNSRAQWLGQDPMVEVRGIRHRPEKLVGMT